MLARILPKYILITVLIALPVMAGATVVDILVQPSPEVSAAQIKLVDLAKVQSSDAVLAQKLASVLICPSPLPGKTRVITRDQIIVAMRRQGIDESSINLMCPIQFSVKRTASLVTGKALFDTAQEYLLADSSRMGTVTVEPVRLPADISVPMGSLEIRVKDTYQKSPKGRANLPVEIIINGQVYTTVNLPVNVRVFSQVMVAAKPIGRTEAISSENIIFENREITTLPGDLVTDQPQTSVTATVPIAQGSVIRRSWLAEPPVIKSGDAVTVVVSGEMVRVADKGVAVMDGQKGDEIKVRLLGDVREVRGTVVEPGLVEIKLSRRN
ncbi:MAG: flagellar basal body P-ring formation chaperone FlgA [Armatimonadota bacterium]